MIAIKLSG